jgi:hypothetical protein
VPISYIRLIVKHPKNDLKWLTQKVGIEPQACYTIGDEIITPKGTKSGDISGYSLWSGDFSFTNSETFDLMFSKLIDSVNSSVVELSDIVKSGGVISLIFDLDGRVSFSGSVLLDRIEKSIRSGIDFQFQVV